MKLLLMRHGVPDSSGAPSEYGDGPGLSPVGVAQSRAAGEALLKLGFAPECILSSPRARTYETALMVAESFNLSPRTDPLYDPEAAPAAFHQLLTTSYAQYQQLLITGHEPSLEIFASSLVGSKSKSIQFQRGTVAIFDYDIQMGAELLRNGSKTTAAAGTLLSLLTAEQLAAIAEAGNSF